MSEGQLRALAAQLFNSYQQRTGRRGHYTPEQHDRDWMQIARNVSALNADSTGFMDAAFSDTMHNSKHGAAPLVNAMRSPGWCERAWQSREQTSGRGEVDMPDFDTPAETEWWLIKNMNAKCLMRRTGSVDPLNPQVLALLRDRFSQLPAIFRTVFSANDPVVLELFGDEAREYLFSRRAVAEEILKDGLQLPPPK